MREWPVRQRFGSPIRREILIPANLAGFCLEAEGIFFLVSPRGIFDRQYGAIGRINMFRIALVTMLLVVGLASIPAIAADDHVAVSPDQSKWVPAPPAFPKGAQIAVLAGNPSTDGLYVVRLKVPAGYKVPPHIHPNDENITVISGTFNIGMGSTFDEKNGQMLKVGGFLHMPKGMQHFAWFTEDAIIQLHGMGPQSIIYVNPAVDPRKSD